MQFYHIYNSNSETFYTENITLGSSGGIDWVVEPMYVDFSRRTHRYDLELQHNVNLSDTVRAAWGVGVRDDQVWGAQNLMANEEVNNHLKFGFINLEWDTDTPWLVNAGAMVEDYSTTGTSVSPRVGVNYRFSSSHSMRLTGSKAIRTPSMYEYAARYAYAGSTNYYSGGVVVAPGPDVYQEYDVGTRQTDVEHVTSFELGYHGMPANGRVELDIKIYRDYLTDLIGTTFNSPVPGDLDNANFPIVNRANEFEIRGAELEAKINFVDNSALYLGYAFTHSDELFFSDDGTYLNTQESRRAPKHALSLLYMMLRLFIVKRSHIMYMLLVGYIYG